MLLGFMFGSEDNLPSQFQRWRSRLRPGDNSAASQHLCQSFMCAQSTDDPRWCLNTAKMACPQCNARFCSDACFKSSWKQHKMLHKISAEIGPSTATHKTMSSTLHTKPRTTGKSRLGRP